MLVFLSQSGAQSKDVAEGLEKWLPLVMQAVDPWISSDITKGNRWNEEIAGKLEESKVGIICLTKENLNTPWILFEAGALSKTKDARACTLLLNLVHADVPYPLAQFQYTTTAKEDFKKLIQDINSAIRNCGEKALPDAILDAEFEIHWPSLDQIFKEAQGKLPLAAKPQRKELDLLQEVLELVRNLDRKLAPTMTSVLDRMRAMERARVERRSTIDQLKLATYLMNKKGGAPPSGKSTDQEEETLSVPYVAVTKSEPAPPNDQPKNEPEDPKKPAS